MLGALRIQLSDPRPIWRQIEEGVLHLVASGALPPGAAVASVRECAQALRINPATVSKAYQRLTDAGVLIVRRGEGTFVSEEPPVLSARLRRERLREGAVRYASLAVTVQADENEAIERLREAFAELRRRR